jgi:bifunctional DNA-binding transcriptional regulator/antitoxin component of YhaV-PrlF toxin-antitoxin module
MVIPVEIREELGLEEGEVMDARVEDGRLVLQTPLVALERLRKRFREAAKGRDPVAELIAERRAEAIREEEEMDEFRRRHS